MRLPVIMSTLVAGLGFLAACTGNGSDDAVDRAFKDVNVIDESNMLDVMLTVADPEEAIAYFNRSIKEDPGRIEFHRGLALSLMRAKRYPQAVVSFRNVTRMEGATPKDSVDLAHALVRTGKWREAENVLDSVPPTYETFKRYRLEALIADSNKEWKKADSFYEAALGLTTRPASILNNWGYSKLTRGDYKAAERLFADALRQDPTMFTAKNNIVLARSARRNYTLPVIQMSQTERAQLLHTMALSAIKQSDVETGKSLLREAIDTHPQHFEAAVRSLRALEQAPAQNPDFG